MKISNLRWLMVAGLALIAAMVPAQDVRPEDVLKQITELRAARIAKAREANAPLDVAALNLEIQQIVNAAIKDVDPGKVPAGSAYDWAQLFSMVGRHKDVCDLCQTFLTTSPDPQKSFQARILMMNSCNELGEADMLLSSLAAIKPPTAANALTLASMIANLYVPTIVSMKGFETGVEVLDRAIKGVSKPADGASAQDVQAYESVVSRLYAVKAELYVERGDTSSALKCINEGLALLDKSGAGYRSLNSSKVKLTLTGSPAPALNFDRTYGEFKGLEALKGKVVLIDFFAHWCGPCRASFPDMRKLYDDLKDKGLEIVGVTAYYGYYGRDNIEKRDMPKETEYAKMADFMKEFNMNWSVIFGERSNLEAYGVTGIPTVVVIDREGKVHEFKVGYSPDSFGAFRAKIEKLLAK